MTCHYVSHYINNPISCLSAGAMRSMLHLCTPLSTFRLGSPVSRLVSQVLCCVQNLTHCTRTGPVSVPSCSENPSCEATQEAMTKIPQTELRPRADTPLTPNRIKTDTGMRRVNRDRTLPGLSSLSLSCLTQTLCSGFWICTADAPLHAIGSFCSQPPEAEAEAEAPIDEVQSNTNSVRCRTHLS